jgi:hypothetical protein
MRVVGVAGLILTAFLIYWIPASIYIASKKAKQLSSKQGRQEIKNEVIGAAQFMATDKYFRQEFHREFRGTYIVIGLVFIALIGTALGLG